MQEGGRFLGLIRFPEGVYSAKFCTAFLAGGVPLSNTQMSFARGLPEDLVSVVVSEAKIPESFLEVRRRMLMTKMKCKDFRSENSEDEGNKPPLVSSIVLVRTCSR